MRLETPSPDSHFGLNLEKARALSAGALIDKEGVAWSAYRSRE
jgi:hypothetical protein